MQISPLRTLLIGAGDYGRVHADTIARLPDAQLVGVVDQDTQRADVIAAAHDVPVWRGVDLALSAADPQVVVVATPTASHVSLAISALRAGAHVIVEKPVAAHASDALILASEARQAKRAVEVISQRRYQEGNQRLKELLDRGELGRIGSVTVDTAVWRTADYFDLAPWRGIRSLGGGNLMNHGIHAVDLLTWFVGPLATAHGFAAPSRFADVEVEDALAGAFQTEAGVIGTIHASLAARPGGRFEIVITGDGGTARVTDRSVTATRTVREKAYDFEFPSGDTDSALSAEYADFVARICRGDTSCASLDAGIETLRAAELILDACLGVMTCTTTIQN